MLRIAVKEPPSLLEQIEKDERGLLRAVRRVLPEGGELLLVIDQLEEIFTLVEDPEDTAFLLQSLYEAVVDPHSPLRVIATLRADFYDRPLTYPQFGKLVEERTAIVLPLSTEELERAIRVPVERVGTVFEAGLVNTILSDVADQPGTLPLLQYTLTELFERRTGRMLTFDSYQALGGVLGALGERAEEIYASLELESQKASHQLFLRLITLGEGTEDTRRRVLRVELEGLISDQGVGDRGHTSEINDQQSTISNVIDVFGAARLLSFYNDPVTRRPTVEVAHEALLYEWRRLREWLDESRADIRTQRVLANAAAEWQEAESDPGFLLRGTRLDQFEAWVQESSVVLTENESEFLEVSLAERSQREAEEVKRQAHEAALERRSRNFLRALAVVLAAAAIVAVILSGVALKERSAAQRSAQQAVQSALTATGAQGQAQNEAATAVVAQADAQYQAEQAANAAAQAEAAAAEEALARQEAEKESRKAKSRELVAFTLSELDQPTDVSRSLGLLLAREAILTTLKTDGYVIGPAEAVLRQAINTTPVLRMALKGHSGPVNSAAWSPFGRYIVTAGEDDTARIWEAESGEEVRVLGGHTAAVNTAFWSPDGTLIVTASTDFSIRIWDSYTVQQLNQLQGHTSTVKSATWSPDGARIVSAGGDGTVRVWNVLTGEQLIQIGLEYLRGTAAFPITIYFATFSPDGNRIAIASQRTMISIWDSLTGEEQLQMDANAGQVNTVKWNSDGSRLVSSHGNNIAYVWELETGKAFRELEHISPVQYASWSSDDSQIVTVTSDGVIHIWDSQSGEELQQLQANSYPFRSVDWSLDGTQLLTSGDDGVTRIWETGTKEQRQTLEHSSMVSSASWRPDGKRIATTAGWTTFIWDAVNGVRLNELEGHFGHVTSVTWSPNGENVITSSFDGTCRIWDAQNGIELLNLQGYTMVVNYAAFSPDGEYIVTANQDRTAQIWDAENGEEIRILRGHTRDVVSAAWSPEGDQVITTSADGTARIWDANTGDEPIQLMGHTNSVNTAVWNPAGTLVGTGSSDRTVRIWDVQTGEQLILLEGHSGPIYSVDWSPDGLQLVTASGDRSVRLWDVNTGEEVGQIRGHDNTIWTAAWSPDGSQILTASGDKTARIWPVGIEGLLKQAESLIQRDPPEFTTEERCVYLHECGED